MTGLFINFEGVDGSGKTTQIEMLVNSLKSLGLPVVTTIEPGGTEMANDIRTLVKIKRSEEVYVKTEILLFFAARYQNYKNIILPSIEAGNITISDRHTPSTVAYQTAKNKADLSTILEIDKIIMNSLRPDMTFILDLGIDVSSSRLQRRPETSSDRFDSADDEYMREVRQSYLDQAKERPDIFRVIEANDKKEVVHERIKKQVLDFIVKKMGAIYVE